MLNVTDEATAFIGKALDAQSQHDTDVFRLSRSGQDLEFAIDKEHEGDQVVQADDRAVLVIESEISQALDGATIDTIDTPEGKQLTVLLNEAQ